MKERAAHLSQKTGKLISATQLRSLYIGRGVTTQLPVVRLGKPKLDSPEVQQKAIDECRQKFLNLFFSEYEIISVDSASFSPKHVRSATWAPIGDPILWQEKYGGPKYCCVHSGASVKSGLIHSIYKMPIVANKKNNIAKEGGFNSRDILRFYKELRAKHPGRIAIYADNGRYQNSIDIRKWSEESGVPIMNNLKYRPECNGIEEIWAYAKKKYRAIVSHHKAMEMSWDQLEVISAIMESVPKETASKCIQRGWDALRAAKPIVPGDPSNPKPRGWDPTKFAPHVHEDDEVVEVKAASDEESEDDSSSSDIDFLAGLGKGSVQSFPSLTKVKGKKPG